MRPKNYQFLEQSFVRAGCQVSWVKYSRSNLLKDLIAFLKKRYCFGLDWESFRPLPPPQGASPRRSLDFGVAPVARQVNKLCKAGLISVDVRQDLLVTLLAASKGLSSNSIDNHALRGELVGISWLSANFFGAMCDYHAANKPYTLQYHYEENISDLSAEYEISYLKIPDLIWAEIDMESHYQRVLNEVYPRIQARENKEIRPKLAYS